MEYEEFCDMVSENARAAHRTYLESNEWKEKRARIFERDKSLCQDCKVISKRIFNEIFKKVILDFDLDIDLNYKMKASQVHHTTYESLHTPQEEDDCISLCSDCHKVKHSGLRYDYRKNVIKRDKKIIRIIHRRLLKHPKIIELVKKQHNDFIKSLITKPKDWLNNKVNEVENGKD